MTIEKKAKKKKHAERSKQTVLFVNLTPENKAWLVGKCRTALDKTVPQALLVNRILRGLRSNPRVLDKLVGRA